MKSAVRGVLPTPIISVLRRMKGAGRAPVKKTPTRFSEAEVILVYFRRYPHDGTMLDVGAHFGGSFAPYRKMGWRIWAFEPDPEKKSSLARYADDPHVTILPYALSNENKANVSFFASSESTGISTLSPFRESHREIAQVDVRTLTSVVEEQKINRVDFLKVDAEGFDLFVLEGFPWDTMRPEIVLCEFEDKKTQQLGYDYHHLARFLLDKDFCVFLSEWQPIERYGGNHRWRDIRPYPTNLVDQDGWGNLIAIHHQFDPQPLVEEIERLKARARN